MNAFSAILAGGIALVFAALMTVQRSLYASALCLLVVLLQTAVLFYLSGAPLLAFLQVMIYAGAVMVLVVVAIMAAPSTLDKLWSRLFVPRPAAVLGLALLLSELAALLSRPAVFVAQASAPPSPSLGSILFGPYAVATEAVTVLMLLSALAVVGRRGSGGAG